MKKIKLAVTFLLLAAFLATLVVHAESDRQIQPGKIKQKPVTQVKPARTSMPQRAPVIDSRQGYQMVTDVLDGLGGESESANYRIPVNSGGQPSPIGISGSDSWDAKAGFVYASRVKHGDANGDGALDLGDAIHILNYLFKSGPDPCPMEAGDANCDGLVDLGDAIFLLNYLFKGGPAPSC